MALGYETTVVNGQMVNVAPGQGYSPLVFGSQYTGPGYWPRNGVYNVPPVTPAAGTWEGSSTPAGTSGGGSVTGNQPMPTAGAWRSDGSVNYFHGTRSPLLWALGFLAVGLLLLHNVHYK